MGDNLNKLQRQYENIGYKLISFWEDDINKNFKNVKSIILTEINNMENK